MRHNKPVRGPWPAALFPLILLAGCGSGYEFDILRGSAALKAARTDAQRASALAVRGGGYAEKARILRFTKRVSRPDYDALFARAVKDLDEAVSLAPKDPQVFLKRGEAYFFRAYPGPPDNWETKAAARPWLDKAVADYSTAIELAPDLEQAYDMRGVIRHDLEDYDAAIPDFEQVRRLNPKLGKLRLADAYCARGGRKDKDKLLDGAIADLETARALAAPTDGCECDPYLELAALYLDRKHDPDKSWSIVHAAKGKAYIPPEFLARLKKETGRDD